MPDAEELRRMREADLTAADRDALSDIRNIEIDKEEPPEARVQRYLEQVKNPYLVRCGDYVLKFCYADEKKTFGDRLSEYVERLLEAGDDAPFEEEP